MIRERDRLAGSPARATALACVEAGIEAALPGRVVRERVAVEGGNLRVTPAPSSGDSPTLPDLADYDEVVVLGGGKPAGRVASALEDVLGAHLDGGVVVADAPAATDRATVVEGSHPLPDEAAVAGARRILDRAAAAGERTLVLAVVAGGGSALLPAPAGDLALEDLRAVTDDLLAAGAPIEDVNAVRKHVSALKGGQLAREAAPATVLGLVFSDVVGDDLDAVASGPTAPDPTTYDDAIAALDRHGVDATGVRAHLERGAAGDIPETPAPGDPAFDRVSNVVLANAWTALDAAREAARERGYEPLVLSSRVRGEAREAGLAHLAVAEEVRATGNPVEPPAVVLSGGETTVAVRGEGTGGPNQEFALAAAVELDDDGVAVAAVDTDGRDGSTDAAGAIVDAATVDGADAAREALDDNDAYDYLAARDALVLTGRTGTNVNDLRVLAVDGS